MCTARKHHALPATVFRKQVYSGKNSNKLKAQQQTLQSDELSLAQSHRARVLVSGVAHCGSNGRNQVILAMCEWSSRPLPEPPQLHTRTLMADLCPQKCLWFSLKYKISSPTGKSLWCCGKCMNYEYRHSAGGVNTCWCILYWLIWNWNEFSEQQRIKTKQKMSLSPFDLNLHSIRFWLGEWDNFHITSAKIPLFNIHQLRCFERWVL